MNTARWPGLNAPATWIIRVVSATVKVTGPNSTVAIEKSLRDPGGLARVVTTSRNRIAFLAAAFGFDRVLLPRMRQDVPYAFSPHHRRRGRRQAALRGSVRAAAGYGPGSAVSDGGCVQGRSQAGDPPRP